MDQRKELEKFSFRWDRVSLFKTWQRAWL